MAQCNISELYELSKCFTGYTQGDLRALEMQLLCELVVQSASTRTIEEDLVVPAESIGPSAATGTAVVNSGQSADQYALVLNAAPPPGDSFWVAVQMPHSWVAGTRVYPHLHYQPQNNVAFLANWQISYQVADTGDAFPASTVVNAAITTPANMQWRHLTMFMPTGGIDMTGMQESAIIRMNIQCTGTTQDIHMVSFDLHYQRYS